MLDAPIAARSGTSTYLTDAFIRAGKRFTLLEFANGAAFASPEDLGVIRIGGNEGFPIAKVSSAHATMPRRARPICCGLMAMLPRASGSRHDQPSRARWRVRQASTEGPSWHCPPAQILPSRTTHSVLLSRPIAD